jgi:hypothetical protein
LKCDAYGTTNFVGIFDDVIASDECSSSCWLQKCCEHAHGRALAGTVGTEESENLALLHFEIDAVDGFDGIVASSEIAGESCRNNGGLSHKVALYKFSLSIYEKTPLINVTVDERGLDEF